MHQRHHTAESIQLTARTSLLWPAGVRTCGSHTQTIRYSVAIDALCFVTGEFFAGQSLKVRCKHRSSQFPFWTVGFYCER